jgi:hypothetical protein
LELSLECVLSNSQWLSQIADVEQRDLSRTDRAARCILPDRQQMVLIDGCRRNSFAYKTSSFLQPSNHMQSLINMSPIWLRSVAVVAIVAIVVGIAAPCSAQLAQEHIGEIVPRDVREMYDRGLQYLIKTQGDNGGWSGGEQGPGVTGMALMAFLASGEDPNFGLYSKQVRKAVKNIIQGQNASTGYFGNSMYHHGFAMLAETAS